MDTEHGTQGLSDDTLLIFPATAAQRGLWFLEQLHGANSAYTLPLGLRLHGLLDRAALERAFRALVARHEALRTGLRSLRGEVVQAIEDRVAFALEAVACPTEPEERDAEIGRRFADAARIPFDVQRPPLLRALLLCFEPSDHALLILAHHAIADAESLRVMLDDLSLLYRRECGEPLDPLPEPGLQFGDYVEWQRAAQTTQAARGALAYWRDRLDGAPALALPTDRPPPPHLGPAGAVHAFALDPTSVRAFEASALAQGATPFMAWLALYALLLARRCEQTDLCVATPFANRDRPEFDRAVGFFADTLVLRIDAENAPTFRTLLARVRETVLDALAHRGVPLDEIVSELRLPRAAWRTPLFQTLFAFLDPLPALPEFPGLTLAPVRVHSASAKVELGLELVRDRDGLRAEFEYNVALFEPETIAELGRRFADLLNEVAADPNLPLRIAARGVAAHPAGAEPPPAGDGAAQDGTLEGELAALWHGLLGAEVESGTHFFLSGGHSLLAVQLARLMREGWAVDFGVGEIFAHPTLGALARRLREALETGSGAGVAPLDPIPHVPRGVPLAASPAQTRLWLLQRLEPESPAYNIFGAFRIVGPLDQEILRRALAEVQRRHEALRTAFVQIDGRPAQTIAPATGIALPVVDLGHLPAALRGEEIERLGRQEARRPFDLDTAPLVRVRLLRSTADEHVLFVTLHHAIADGWSVEIIARELALLYDALAERRPLDLPAPALQYADYAAWHERALASTRDASLAYWRARLEGVAPLELPSDRARPAEPAYEGRRHEFRLDSATLAAAGELAARHGTTRFALLLAVYAALLARYAGQTNFAIGIPVANRPRPDLDAVVGCFVNVVPIRIDLSRAPSFAGLLAAVRDALRDVETHGELPFEELVAGLDLPRELGRHPVFQVLMAYQAAMERTVPAGAVTPLALDPGIAQFDLALHVDDAPEGARCAWVHRTELYDAGTIARMERHFRRLLEGALADPQCAVDRLPILSAEESALLRHWNDTRVDYKAGGRLTDLLAEALARDPDALAVRGAGESLTYRAFYERVAALAHVLRDAGASGGTVGVCLERSNAQAIAFTAALFAGGAFFPIDPELPPERIATMLEDARPVAVVTSGALRGRLPASTATIDVEALNWDSGARLDALPGPADPGATAYVLFTSGSTGRPKGVAVPHRGLVNRLLWMQQYYPIGPGDRVLQKTPASFDVSVWEFFWPLLAGAELVIAQPGGHRDPRYLNAAIAEHRVTVVHFVPSMLEAFLDALDPVSCASLRRVFTSGETLTAELEHRFFRRGLSATLHNLYGPTEASIDVTAYDCIPPGGKRRPPIGFAVPNTQLHVLDAHGAALPVGVAGELFIGGVQLATGYAGRDELTAERFVDHPEYGRLYRTGDRARYLLDGSLEYLGRLDFQVKLRGARIELGEIEAALLEDPAIRSAVCVVRGDDPAAAVLAAYVAGAPDESIDVAAQRARLAERLPSYMLPATITVLDALPLSSNGKVDRRALPEPRAEREALAEVPRGEVESRVAAAWAAALGRTDFSTRENFFDAGGTSLLLIKVQAALQADYPSLALADLFRFPTVRSLAAHLHPAQPGGSRHAPLPERARAASGAVAIVGMAGRFPGAETVEAFWENLCAGRESIETLERADLEGRVPAVLADDPRYVRACASPPGADRFDAAFFGYSPAEADALDPQHRLFLQSAWEALESAALDVQRHPGAVGVYAGTSLSTYGLNRLLADPSSLADPAAAFQTLFESDKDYLATRAAYKLGLHGPALAVQTACSTSLVAVHLACRALRHGEVDVALAGGASLSVPTGVGYLYQEGGIASPDGHCRAFDEKANGTVPASGVGVVVLKRLEDALAARDRIVAVIRGTAVNNDGDAKVGFTAPSVDGQAAAIAAAQDDAGISPLSVGYVEAHGTGTRLGDLVEISALARAFRRDGATPPVAGCALGSLKTNVGHMDAAAGVAGLIKAALAVERGLLPPSLHFERPDARLGLEDSPFYVNTSLRAWGERDAPRRAGVSSFGIGGTNAHVIVEQPPPSEPVAAGRAVQVLTLSAKTPAALEAMSQRLAHHLDRTPDADLAAAAFTLQTGRREFAHRRIVVASDLRQAIDELAAPARAGTLADLSNAPGPLPIAFLFPGQGTQYLGMAARCFETLPAFRAAAERCLGALDDELAGALRADVFSPPGRTIGIESTLAQTHHAQPALFITSYALAVALRSWGVQPDVLAGHSVGEFAAAAFAGVFRPEDAARLVALRGALMAAMPRGAMLAVELGATELAALLPGDVAVAAINGPRATVAAGPVPAIDALAARLEADGIATHRLRTSHAFHSPMMEPVVELFAQEVARVPLARPEIPIAGPDDPANPAYWAAQLREPVRFGDVLTRLLGGAQRALVEVGPGTTLLALARANPAYDGQPLIATLPGPVERIDADQRLTEAAGKLWLAGCEFDWERVHAPGAPRRCALPAYPFAAERHWIETPPQRAVQAAVATELYRPGWSRGEAARVAAELSGERWTLAGPRTPLGDAIAAAARARGAVVTEGADGGDGRVVFCADGTDERTWTALVRLVQTLAARAGSLPHLVVLTQGAEDTLGDEPFDRIGAGARAIALVAAQEIPGLTVRVLDLAGPGDAETAVAEIAASASTEQAALRHGSLWQRTWQPFEARARAPLPARPVVLIAGGFGKVGLAVARHLAVRHQARLVLFGRRGARGAERAVAELEAAGADVLALAGDVTDRAAIAAAVAQTLERFGRLDGAVHAAGLDARAVHVALDALDERSARAIWDAKLRGIDALAEAVRGAEPEFVVACSSLAAVLGGLGLGAYAAANAALDNAALRHGRAARTRWIAIDWDGWAFEPDAAVPSIAPEHGGSLFERIVTSGIRGRIAVSATPLHARLGAWLERAPSVAHEAAPAAAPRASRVPFVAPRTGLEASIAAVWSELLGVAEIGVDDDFFELGGHSLVAVRMLARLREFAGVPLTAATILEASTIAELAQRIDALRWAVGAQSSAVGEDVEEGEI